MRSKCIFVCWGQRVATARGGGGAALCLWDKLEATAAPPRPPPPLPPPSRPSTLSPPQPRLLGRAAPAAGEAEEAAQDSQLFCLKVQSHRRASPRRLPEHRPSPQCAAPRRRRRVVFPKRKGIWKGDSKIVYSYGFFF